MTDNATPAHPQSDPARAVLALILVTAAIRFATAATIGLGVDESYTVANARHFQLSYFDHPPLSFWIVRATVALTGSEAGWVVRAPFILMFAASTWLMYRLGARLYGERAGFWAALALNLAPVFTISTGGWALPDGPLILAFLAVAHSLVRIFFEPRAAPWAWWLAAGACLGVALLAKYHGLLLAAGLFLFLLSSPAHRHWLAHPAPYVAFGLALLVFSPVLVWNAQHDWVSFRFQGGRGLPGGELKPGRVLANILGQAAYLLPWIWAALVWLLVRHARRGPRADARAWLLCCLAILPVAIFTITPLWGARGLPHWQAPGYLFLFPLLGAWLAERRVHRPAWTLNWARGTAAFMAVLVTVLATHTATGWIKTALPFAFAKGDPALEALDWTDLRAALAERGLLDREDLFVVSPLWLEAGKIDYAFGGRLPVLVFTEDPRNFAFQHAPAAFLGQNAIIVGRAKTMQGAAERYAPWFEAIEPLPSVWLTRGGRPELELPLLYADNLRSPYPLPY